MLIIIGVYAVLIQGISSQCIGSRWGTAPFPTEPTTGGFLVQSASPIYPTGVTVLSDRLVIEGPLVIDGNLPFLGTVAFEGSLPTAGVGSVTHACGGPIGITEIAPVGVAGLSASPAVGAPFAGLGLGGPAFGLGPRGVQPGLGLGCGRVMY